ALVAVDELVLARRHSRGREVTIVRRGQLAAVGVVDPDDPGGVDALPAGAAAGGTLDRPPRRRAPPGGALAGRGRRRGRAARRDRLPGQPVRRRRRAPGALHPTPLPRRAPARRGPPPPPPPPRPPPRRAGAGGRAPPPGPRFPKRGAHDPAGRTPWSSVPSSSSRPSEPRS